MTTAVSQVTGQTSIQPVFPMALASRVTVLVQISLTLHQLGMTGLNPRPSLGIQECAMLFCIKAEPFYSHCVTGARPMSILGAIRLVTRGACRVISRVRYYRL